MSSDPERPVVAQRPDGACARTVLKREDWDFSGLKDDELIPALIWEVARECPEVDARMVATRAWLAGKLSEMKPPMPKDKRTGKRPRHNTNFSEADVARLRAGSGFDEFIPWGEFQCLRKWTRAEVQREYAAWLAGYLRPIVKHHGVPWLCLPPAERSRLVAVFDRSRRSHVVCVAAWNEAIRHFEQHQLDDGLPLKFDYGDHTCVLLNINWKHSKKRILAAMGRLLDEWQPTGVKRWDGRGRKDRDLRVMLERIAIMRLLHHHPLSEIKRLEPAAWACYANRKWYDERRRALKDYRSNVGFSKPEGRFPKSWSTKSQRARQGGELPTK